MIDIEKFRKIFIEYFNPKSIYFISRDDKKIKFALKMFSSFISHNEFFESESFGELFLVSFEMDFYDELVNYIND